MAGVSSGPGKSPIVAVLATFFLYFLPGVGQLYAGRGGRGLALFLGTYASALLFSWLLMALGPSSARWLPMPLAAAWWCFLAYDAYRCALESPPAVEDLPPAPPASAPYEQASRRLRLTWAATRLAVLAAGTLPALYALALGLVGAGAALRLGAAAALGWPLLFLAAGAGLLAWLAMRARRVWATAAGPAPLPSERLRSEARGFFLGAAALAALLAFGAFLTQGIWRDLVRRSDEGASRGNLAALRLALGNARAAELGLAPASIAELMPLHLTAIPPAKLRVSAFSRYHPDSAAVRVGKEPTDEGGWLYDPGPGTVLVNCTHTDSKGTVWSGY